MLAPHEPLRWVAVLAAGCCVHVATPLPKERIRILSIQDGLCGSRGSCKHDGLR